MVNNYKASIDLIEIFADLRKLKSDLSTIARFSLVEYKPDRYKMEKWTESYMADRWYLKYQEDFYIGEIYLRNLNY